MRDRRWFRHWVGVSAALALSGAASGCWVQQKGADAARVIRSASRATEAGTATGDIQFTVRIVKVQGQDIERVARLRAQQLAAAPGGGRVPAGGNGNGGGGAQSATAAPGGDVSAALVPIAGGPAPAAAPAAPGQASQAGQAAQPERDPTKEQVSPPFAISVDLAHDRAAIAAVDNGTDVPLARYFGWTLFRFAPPVNIDLKAAIAADKKPAPATDATSESDTEATELPRVWLKLDYAHIDSKKKAELQGITLFPSVPPTFLVRLLKGCLTGSVKVEGIDTLDGVRTTHYRFNLDRYKAMQGMSDKDRRTTELIFQRSGFTTAVSRNAEVWLDEQGRPRRFLVRFNQHIRSDAAVVGFVLNFKKVGEPVAIDAPISDVTSTVADFPQLVSGRA